MLDASALLDRQYHEMRCRILSLAADFDRLQRAQGGEMIQANVRITKLRACLAELARDTPDRAERVQLLLSDGVPLPLPTGRGLG